MTARRLLHRWFRGLGTIAARYRARGASTPWYAGNGGTRREPLQQFQRIQEAARSGRRESFAIPGKHIHEAKNASASDHWKLLVFLAGEKGQPIATAVTLPYFWKQ